MNLDEDNLLLLLDICICQAVLLCQLPFKKRKKHKTWVKDWLHYRETLGLQLQDGYHNNSFWFE